MSLRPLHSKIPDRGGVPVAAAHDIVLMHFRPEMQQDMTAFLRQAAADDLAVAGLENYLTPGR